jgi:hypothetical protein
VCVLMREDAGEKNTDRKIERIEKRVEGGK